MTVFPHLPKIGDFLLNVNKKRFNGRITTSLFTFFFMIARSQKLEGVTSRVFDINGKPTENHYVFWDCDIPDLEKIKTVLTKVQQIYNLSDIFVTSDNNRSFRAWCFSIVDFPTFLKILIDSKEIIDYEFLSYTFRRKEATLRVSKKENRPFQCIIGVLKTFSAPFPTGTMRQITYVTGCEKKGTTLSLGVD
jgi:hypothetical protein